MPMELNSIIFELTDLLFLVYAVGQFKDDQLQNHTHFICQESGDTGPYGGTSFICRSIYSNSYGEVSTGLVKSSYRSGNSTRTKQKGVMYIVKVL